MNCLLTARAEASLPMLADIVAELGRLKARIAEIELVIAEHVACQAAATVAAGASAAAALLAEMPAASGVDTESGGTEIELTGMDSLDEPHAAAETETPDNPAASISVDAALPAVGAADLEASSPVMAEASNLPAEAPNTPATLAHDTTATISVGAIPVDDFMLIKGIDAATLDVLAGLGLTHFRDIAAFTPEDVCLVGEAVGDGKRVNRECWIEQAALLAAGTTTAFARERLGASAVVIEEVAPETPLLTLVVNNDTAAPAKRAPAPALTVIEGGVKTAPARSRHILRRAAMAAGIALVATVATTGYGPTSELTRELLMRTTDAGGLATAANFYRQLAATAF